MRNLKKVLSLALVLMMVLSVVSGAAYIGYSDEDTITAINEDYIVAAKLLNELGIVVGSVNETGAVVYDGQGAIDRAQLARVLYVLYSGNNEYSKIYNPGEAFLSLACPFTDIDGNWAEGYIKYGYNKGYLNGKDNNKYDPTANVTAAEMATALLAVIGYNKADLAKNWPSNVILYGYEGVDTNLFTTGLSVQNQDPTILANDGWHVLGMDALVETEDELSIDEELTREQAFYMMYRAINNRRLVAKFQNGDVVAASELIAAFLSSNGAPLIKANNGYVAIPVNFIEAVFGEDCGAYYEGWFDATIVGTPDTALVGAKTPAGYDVSICRDDGNIYNYKDLGYTAVQGKSSVKGKAAAYGYKLSATDWAAHLGQKIRARKVCINDEWYLTNYMFEYDARGNAKFNGFKGTGITTVENVELTGIDAAAIDGYGFWTVGGKNTYDLTINGTKSTLNAADFKAEIIKAAGKKTHDKATKITLVDGKIYSAEIERYTTVLLTEDNIAKAANIEGAHIGDLILCYEANGKYVGRKATKLWAQTISVKTEGSKTTAKYGDTEVVFGDDYVTNAYTHDPMKVSDFDITKKYNLWVDGGYVYGYQAYDASNPKAMYMYDTQTVRVATFKSIACVKTYNTTDAQYTFTYTVTVVDKDKKEYSYNFTVKGATGLTEADIEGFKTYDFKWDEDEVVSGYVVKENGDNKALFTRDTAYFVVDNLQTGETEIFREDPNPVGNPGADIFWELNVDTTRYYALNAYLWNIEKDVNEVFKWTKVVTPQ